MKISFANDCDFLTRQSFEEVHQFMRSLSLDVGDSFWLFDPSGGDMALFTHDTSHPGPQHSWLLDRINEGTLDVLHSAGSFGSRFNNGFRPSRAEIAKALDYLAKHARVPAIHTNHGDSQNIQNVGTAGRESYHEGDRPDSDAYCLDLYQDYGVRYFWLDSGIHRDPLTPYRVVQSQRCNDGSTIKTFVRFLSPMVEWSPNGQNFAEQLDLSCMRSLVSNHQPTIFYTHWGAHHQGRTAVIPTTHALTDSSRSALERFVLELQEQYIEIVRLESMLDDCDRQPVSDEVQRIGLALVRKEESKQDNFYFNQYGKHGLSYFQRRIDGLNVGGSKALDAGCGVGQWSYALMDHFEEVHGVEVNQEALEILRALRELVGSDSSPVFHEQSIENLAFDSNEFEFIFCYGVIFCADIRASLEEFHRTLRDNGQLYVCLNGDGWYEYLIDERFRDVRAEDVITYIQPLFNALVARCGGERAFSSALQPHQAFISNLSISPVDLRRLLLEELSPLMKEEVIPLLHTYSDRIVSGLGVLTRDFLVNYKTSTRRTFWGNRRRPPLRPMSVNDFFPRMGVGSSNRPFQPGEFEDLLRLHGFQMTAWGSDGALSDDELVAPIYEPTFNDHISVWECLASRIPHL